MRASRPQPYHHRYMPFPYGSAPSPDIILYSSPLHVRVDSFFQIILVAYVQIR
jgi:hypothetical protein